MNKSMLLFSAGLLCVCAAHANTVVIGNLSAADLTKDRIANIYLGKDQGFTPLDQSESAPIRADFYKQITGRDLSQVKAIWSRLLFSGRGQPPKTLANSEAVKKAVAADPKALGYIDKSALDSSVKVLISLD